ncbi:hypothetical protein PG985_009946 [Apiospora marii]|uniref:uncharacterized protein n=1 Tax=Apiospora marii TaxID=335849 RepID=UPI003131D509
MTHPYVYNPLDLSQDSIRFLRLLRGQDHDDICCDVFQAFVNDEDTLSYEALSYTWGGGVTESSPTITLDGQKVSITQNLFEALLNLRRIDSDRVLWVDSLCINQEDHREKGLQVGQMRRTYEMADMVIVWLGPSSPEIDSLMDWMTDMARRLRRSSWRHMPLHEIKHALSPSCPELEDRDGSLHWQLAFLYLTERPWFRRIWIIQEVTVAKAATVVCGRRSVSTSIFSLIPTILNIQLSSYASAVVEAMPGLLRPQPASQDRRLGTLLRKFRFNESSLPHDRIYALLGLTSNALDFPIEYEIPFAHLVLKVAAFLATGSVDHTAAYIKSGLTFQDLSEGPPDQQGFFEYLFRLTLWRNETDFPLFLMQSSSYSQRYKPLHLVPEHHEDGSVIPKLLSRAKLDWIGRDLDPAALSKGFRVHAMAIAGLRHPNVWLLEKIASFEDFVISVDDLRAIETNLDVAIVSPGDNKEEPGGRHLHQIVSSAIRSSILRQIQSYDRYNEAEDNTDRAYHLGQIENWSYGILMIVLRHGRVDLIGLLLDQARYLDSIRVHEGLTPTEAAARSGSSAALAFLLEAEARAGASHSIHHKPLLALWLIPTMDEVYPLHHISFVQSSLDWESDELAKLQIARGVDFNENTAIDQSMRRTVELLLELGANIEEPYQGKTPLYCAVIKNLGSTVELLLGRGAKTDDQWEGKPLLHYAIAYSRDSIVELLLQSQVGLEVPYMGKTPLWYAVELARTSVVKMLLRRGANQKVRGRNGQTLLRLAKTRGIDSLLQRFNYHRWRRGGITATQGRGAPKPTPHWFHRLWAE